MPLFLLPLCGCPLLAVAAVGAAATYGAVRYTENEAYEDYQATLDVTWQATVTALKKMHYPIGDAVSHDVTEGTIRVEDVIVDVESHPGGMTRVRVRIGTFMTDDHKRRARLILEQVQAALEKKT